MTRTLVSLVVPCCDEEEALPKLWDRFQASVRLVPEGYGLEFVFVDDGSRDGTWRILSELTKGRADCILVRHESRRGIGAGLRSALQASHGEVIAVLDADGTYDPSRLPELIRYLDDADLVTGSPYHPKGSVLNVPAWRLFLSKSLSRLYRAVSPVKVWTYTSLFRAYRREVLEKVAWTSDGFLSNTEILIGAARSGFRVAEFPTTLSVRCYGQSKLRTLSVIREHLGFLGRELKTGTSHRQIGLRTEGGAVSPASEERRGWYR
ncbi:MAG: glycosyltransferase family 2 protein [Candidatus Eisenbacteria bacterium]